MDVRRVLAFFLIVVVSFGVIAWTSPGLVKELRLGLDLKGGFEILYEAETLEPGGKVTKEALVQTAGSLEKRASQGGIGEPEVTPEGTNRIRVKIAGVTDEAKVREMMKRPANLTFRSTDGCKDANDFCKIELKGNEFVENAAQVAYDELNQPMINIKVKDKAKFADITKRLLNKPLAIYLDEEQLSAPTVRNVLTDGNATISGSYTRDEATQLKDIINLGALPLKLTEKYTQSVGATLGTLSLHQTIEASLIASGLILLFMILFYRTPGIVASIGLVAYVWLLLLILYFMGATLTLPGIAALVLGVGIAVDSNIIMNERIREEIRSGKSVMSGLRAGSKNSFRTIIDAHVTSIIAGVVLYWIGTGGVQGFALIHIISILVNIITNVFFSRYLLVLLVRSKMLNKPSHFGVKESEINAL